ncbi:MAG: hypothetical protein HYZ90_07265 [Candidatus Omnitrophica bacterium]|nr:hypothetical protein [Candidatus Omnitrophota bacterium]
MDREEQLTRWMAEAGFSGALLEREGGLLIVRLGAAGRAHLLADSGFREQLISQAKRLGYSRVALELNP